MEPDATSSAYQAGQLVGRTIVPIVMVLLLLGGGALFILSMIKSFTRKTRGWIILAIVTGLLALTGLIGGVGYVVTKAVNSSTARSTSGATKTVTGKSGAFTIETPSNWVEMAQLTSKAEAQVGVGNGRQEVYTIVIEESREDYTGTHVDYDNQVLKNMRSKMTTPNSSSTTTKTINGLPARQTRLEGTFDHLRIVYHMATVESPDCYYQILTWTMPSHETQAKPVLEQVIESFKVLPTHGPAKSDHKLTGSTEDKLRSLVAAQLDLDPSTIKSESGFAKDLGADDLDIVELVMAVEEEFDLEIPDAEAEKLLTFGDLLHWIEGKKNPPAPAESH